MAQMESPNRLIYSKEFILQYSHIQKNEPTISKLLTPFTSPPKKKITSTPGPGVGSKPRSKLWTPDTLSDDTNKLQVPQTEPRSKNHPSKQLLKENVHSNFHPSMSSSPSKTSQPLSPTNNTLSPPTSPRLKVVPTVKTPLPISPAKIAPKSTPPSTPHNFKPSLPKSPRNQFLFPPGHPNENGPIVAVTPQKSPGRSKNEGPQQQAVMTPPRTPASPRSTAVSPLRSPRSPARPISPLDDQRLQQRQKQIDYGYRTVGYLRYRLLVPKDQRKADFPRTPKKNQGCSKRSWDGQLKKWRRELHKWDPDSTGTFRAVLDSDLVKNIIVSCPELEEIIRIVKDKIDNPSAHLDNDDIEEDSSNSMENETKSDTNSTVPKIVEIKEQTNTPPQSSADKKNIKNEGISSKKKVSPSKIDEPGFSKVARTLVF